MADASITADAWGLRAAHARLRPLSYVAVLITVLTMAAAMAGGPQLYSLLGPGIDDGSLSAMAYDRAVFYAATIGPFYLVALTMLAIERRPWAPDHLDPVVAAMVGAALGLAGVGAALVVTNVAGVLTVGPPVTPLSSGLIGVGLGAVLVGVQVTGQELFFRGWLQPVLAYRLGRPMGLVFTALLFAGMEGIGASPTPFALLNQVLAGLVLGLLALRTGGLAAPIAAHFAWRWVEQSWLGLIPNPGYDPLGSLFDWTLAGPASWSGGTEGLTGGRGTTAALLCMTSLALIWRPGQAWQAASQALRR